MFIKSNSNKFAFIKEKTNFFFGLLQIIYCLKKNKNYD